MIPSQNIDVTKTALTVVCERSRTPSDLLHRALAHINHKAFDVGRLTIFEDPAIAVFNMSPKLAASNVAPSLWKRLIEFFSNKEHGISLSVKVSPLDETKQNFTVRYVMENINKSKLKQGVVEASETLSESLIADMFGAIPDVSLSKTGV